MKLKERLKSPQSSSLSRKRRNPASEPVTDTSSSNFTGIPEASIKQDSFGIPTQTRLGAAASEENNASTAYNLPTVNTSDFQPFLIEPELPLQPEQPQSWPRPVVADPETTTQMTAGDTESWMQQLPLGQPLGDDLPDLRSLMYPSANPFAYGNQPLSILEDSEMMAAEPQQQQQQQQQQQPPPPPPPPQQQHADLFNGRMGHFEMIGSSNGRPLNMSFDSSQFICNSPQQAIYGQGQQGSRHHPRVCKSKGKSISPPRD